ncbi:hypothetical protein G6F37_001431 [Rhizopus arrhizus]|nr:hypothetical protein G6F38_000622 [Rhizopus arrhizus]KAG1163214.1 hypothetical protein G6F37_001431 [Rhizopus arrhizus]
MDSLTNAFMDLKLTKSAVQQFMTNECNLSFKKVQLHAVKRNSPETIQQRYDWAMKYQGTTMDFLTNCVFIDESAFHIYLKRSYGWAPKGKTPVAVVPTTRAKSTTILGAVSIHGVVKITVRKPNPPSSKK